LKQLVFVIESLHLGGAEKSLVTLLQNLDYSKYSVDLIVFNTGGIFESSVPKEVSVIYKSMPPLSFIERLRFKFSKQFNFKKQHAAQLLWNIIQSKFDKITKKHDVAIAYNQGFATYYVERYLSSNLKLAWLNTDYQKAGYAINFDYPIYKNFDSVVAVSPEAKAGLVAELKKNNKELRIEIIKDISDKTLIIKQSQELKPISFNTEKINLVTVGRLAKAKGIHLAVESCKILIEKGHPVHWYVVGEGSERKHIEELVFENKLEPHITLVGMTANPYPYMKDCDIYVQTSLFEGLGLTVIEASYLNKPIVSTNFPTVHGILKDCETGLIAEMNAGSIAYKIELLITNENLKAKLVANLSTATNKDKETTLLQFEKLINEG
jgi:glycosyltransferase involved in cell wall biosynthesis